MDHNEQKSSKQKPNEVLASPHLYLSSALGHTKNDTIKCNNSSRSEGNKFVGPSRPERS